MYEKKCMIFSMFSLVFALYAAGLLTILLPCILPILPVVLGVGIAERNKWRPLIIIAGMIVSFVGFTFLLQVALRQFVEAADFTRIGTYYVLLLLASSRIPSLYN
jgi:cytochrome c-type biogenesis protein